MNKVLIGLLGFVLIGQVNAEDLSGNEVNVRTLHHNNFLGQRAYNNVPSLKSKGANEAWEGTGLVVQDPEQAEKALIKHNQHQMNFIGKRPFLAPHNPD